MWRGVPDEMSPLQDRDDVLHVTYRHGAAGTWFRHPQELSSLRVLHLPGRNHGDAP